MKNNRDRLELLKQWVFYPYLAIETSAFIIKFQNKILEMGDDLWAGEYLFFLEKLAHLIASFCEQIIRCAAVIL